MVLENNLAPEDFELNESDEIFDPNLKEDVEVEKYLERLPEHRKIVESDIVGWANEDFVIEEESYIDDIPFSTKETVQLLNN